MAIETRSQDSMDRLLPFEAEAGGSELGRRINDALRALSRAARSFLLYDAHNDAIRGFLESYRTAMLGAVQAVAAATGARMELELSPTDIRWNGELVYHEPDRERSLAFRMFRDGVRRLSIDPAVEWEELLALLRILSIRYTGIRQQEEDMVTLLWKAGFHHIELVAVEGFAPEDPHRARAPEIFDGSIAGVGERELASGPSGPPLDMDLPTPRLQAPGRVLPLPVSAGELAALRQEASSRALPGLCVRLLSECLALVGDHDRPADWPDIEHLVEEVRDFLLAEGQLGALSEVVRAIEDLRGHDPRQVDRLLTGFVDSRALRRIVHSLPPAQVRLPPELARLLATLPGAHLEHALQVLAEERTEAARRVSGLIVGRFAESDPELVLSWIDNADPAVASDLVQAIGQALPTLRLEVARRAVRRGDPQLALAGLLVLERVEDSPEVHALLVQLLDHARKEVQLRTLEQITGRFAFELFERVRDRYLVLAHHEALTADEAEAWGRALMSLDARRALPMLLGWTGLASWWKRLFHDPRGDRWLRWAAVSGLALSTDPMAEERLRWLSAHGEDELARHSRRLLARRRQEARHA